MARPDEVDKLLDEMLKGKTPEGRGSGNSSSPPKG